MKFGVVVPNATGGVRGETPPSMTEIKRFAATAESLGFDGLWVIDHVLTAEPIYSTTWLDPLVTLSYLAANTTTIRLGTSVVVLPIRVPAVFAKEVSSLDVVSGGRVVAGVGNGWWDKEFEVCGVPKRQRGDRVEEYIQIIKKLWTERNASFKGRYYSFENINLEPKPIQKPHPPIWIAGGSAIGKASVVYQVNAERVLRRIARYADGWIARAYTDLEQVENDWKTIQRHAASFGRSVSEIVFAHINWMCLSEGRTENELRQLFSQSLNIPFEDTKKEALLGTKRQIVEKLEGLAKIGLQYMIVWPTHADYGLLDFLAKDVFPSFC
ncbi:MAG: LLM class flavin-dependent oxidoreductase [Candidatus Caldarchaeum sp.]|nr:LLM class flavin-dependent oxidoreductase [Candidatus Caldarchaeum sp.]